jgi:hypothetical protein
MKRRLLAAFLVLFFLGGVGLVALNVRDYLEIRRITRLPVTISKAVWKGLAESYNPPSDNSRESLSEGEIPLEYRFLKPRKITRSRHMVDICLWRENDDDGRRYAYIWLEVGADKHTRKIHLFHNFEGDQKGFMLWSSAPPPDDLFPEIERICSVSMWGLGGSSKWIVTTKKLVRIEYGLFEGSTDGVVFETDVDEMFRRDLGRALAALPDSVLDKSYRAAGVSDGFGMMLNCRRPGEGGVRSIVLENEWLDAIDPIVALLNSKCPKDHQIYLGGEASKRHEDLLVVGNIGEEQEKWPKPETSWWIIWPKIFTAR